MKHVLRSLAIVAALCAAGSARAQQATVVAACGTPPPGIPFVVGQKAPTLVDINGNTCTSASGGSGGPVSIIQTTPGTTNGVSIPPTSASAIGITPTVSTAGEASHVLKASAGNAYSVYATNLTATAGFLVVLNATSAPVDGAITPLACAPLSANGVASLNYAPGPPGVYSTGITAVVTSASTCFTKTTGVITAFISGSVQ